MTKTMDLQAESKTLEKYGFEVCGPVWVRGNITFRYTISGYEMGVEEKFTNFTRKTTISFNDFNRFTDIYFQLL